jgi:glycosyltransferase involved in cell wall biosynthesis
MRFSVVVPTFNRKDILRQCLDALMAQDYADYEVIVVDDGSTDGTNEMIGAEFPQVKYLYEVNQGQAVARNTGIHAAIGEIVAFTDDDNLVPSDWLSQIASGYRRYPDVTGVAGRMEPPESVWRVNVFARLELWNTWYVYGLSPDRLEFAGEGSDVPGATNNASYRRTALIAVGGFLSTPSKRVVGEERELRERLCAQGYTRYLYIPTCALHLRQYTWKGFLTQTLEAGIGVRQFHRRTKVGVPTLPEIERLRRGQFAGWRKALAAHDGRLVAALSVEKMVYLGARLLPDPVTLHLIRFVSKL